MFEIKRRSAIKLFLFFLLTVGGLTQVSTTLGQSPQTVRNFIFGHSLLNHDPPAIPTPSNETSVPHWLYFLAQADGHSYAVDGQYGFLPQHAQLPPNPQWGFDAPSGVWDVDSGDSFGDADFTTILLTAANFVQYQPATEPYDGENPTNDSPVSATLTIVDWLVAQEPGIDIYIYENWPDMAGFIQSFPPTEAEFAAYNQYTVNGFHDWWVDYHAEITTARPAANVKMIPVGPIISNLLTDPLLSDIPISELYEDDAPHGRPTIYFLASLVTYMTVYGEKASVDFTVPDTIHTTVRTHYTTIVDMIWNELVTYGLVAQPPTTVSLGQSTAFAHHPLLLGLVGVGLLGVSAMFLRRNR